LAVRRVLETLEGMPASQAADAVAAVFAATFEVSAMLHLPLYCIIRKLYIMGDSAQVTNCPMSWCTFILTS